MYTRYGIGTHLDEDEVVELKVLAARGGFPSLGAFVTEICRERILRELASSEPATVEAS